MAGFTFETGSLKDSGGKFKFLQDGTVTDAAGKTLAGTELDAAHAAFASDFNAFKTGKLVEEAQIEHVRDTYDGLVAKAGKTVPGLEPVHDTFLHVDAIEGAVKQTAGKLTAGDEALVQAAIEQPDAFNLVSTQAHHTLNNAELADLAGIRATAARATRMNDALDALVKTGTYDEKAVKNLFHQHGADLFPYLDAEIETALKAGTTATKAAKAVPSVIVTQLQAEVVSEASAYKTQIEGLFDGIATAQKRTGGRGADRAGKEVAEKIGALKKLRVENAHMDRYVHEVFEAHPEKAVIGQAKGMSAVVAEVSKAAEKGAVAAKDGLKFFSFTDQFKVTDGLIAKKTAAAAGDAAKLEKIGKLELGALRKTKLGMSIVGAGAVTYAAYAALGSKGKHADQVLQSQQGQQQGVGVA